MLSWALPSANVEERKESEPFISSPGKNSFWKRNEQKKYPKTCTLIYTIVTTILSIWFLLKLLFPNSDSNLSASMVQPHISTSAESYDTKICLFIISTKREHAPHILQQFQSYDSSKFGLLLNLYDGSDFKADIPSVSMSYVPGWKSSLWLTISAEVVENYDYVWFMDDDLVFSRKVFPFYQFHHVVKTIDAVISSPKVYRPSKEAKFQYSEEKMKPKEILGSHFVADIGVIEIQSFMFKSKAWAYFHDTMLLDIPDIDWGPDCFWCGMFRVESQFGNTSCARTTYYGMTHLDRRSLDHSMNTHKKYLDRGKAAQKKYKQKLREVYKGKIKFECDHHRTLAYIPYTHEFIELSD